MDAPPPHDDSWVMIALMVLIGVLTLVLAYFDLIAYPY